MSRTADDRIFLRDAEPLDAERLYGLKRDCFSSNYLAYSVFRSPRSIVYLAELSAPERKQHGAIEIAGEFEGYYQAALSGEAFHLNYIGVLPHLAGMGIGRQLMQAFESRGRELGAKRLTLDVFESNPNVKAWYERQGYVETNRSELAIVSPQMTSGEPLEIELTDREEARIGEAQRGFSLLHGTLDGEAVEFGVIAGDTIRPRKWPAVDPARLLAWIARELPERSRVILDGSMVSDRFVLIDRQTSIRMERILDAVIPIEATI